MATFFGFQMVVRAARGSPLRSELRGLLVDPSTELDAAQKATVYRRVCSALEDATSLFERGYWDYLDDAGDAKREFDDWCTDIEESAGDPSDPKLGAGDSPYFLVTLAFLLDSGGASDEAVAETCDVEEEAYWTRATFAALVAAAKDLDFTSVRADAAYLKAGALDADTGREEIDGDGYEYLHPLT